MDFNTLRWPDSFKKIIEQSGRGNWRHYAEHSYEANETEPLAIHCFEGVAHHLEAQIQILESLYEECPHVSDMPYRSSLRNKLWGLHKTLLMMHQDLRDLIEFGRETLPHDPWIDEAREKFLKRRPEIGRGTSKGASETEREEPHPVQ